MAVLQIQQHRVSLGGIRILGSDPETFGNSLAALLDNADRRAVAGLELLKFFERRLVDIKHDGFAVVSQEFDLDLFGLRIDGYAPPFGPI
jgi:hypothetical protein